MEPLTCLFVGLCSNGWMSFKLKLGGETVGLWQAYPLVSFQWKNISKPIFGGSFFFFSTRYIFGNCVKLLPEIAEQI